MFKVVVMGIASVFAVLFLVMVYTHIKDEMKASEMVEITSMAAQEEEDMLLVDWETSKPTLGALIIVAGGQNRTETSPLGKRHSVMITDIDGAATYWTNSCTPQGVCVSSESMFGEFRPRTCADGTPYGACQIPPFRCLEGQLVEACNVCGCLPGLICTSTGTCKG